MNRPLFVYRSLWVAGLVAVLLLPPAGLSAQDTVTPPAADPANNGEANGEGTMIDPSQFGFPEDPPPPPEYEEEWGPLYEVYIAAKGARPLSLPDLNASAKQLLAYFQKHAAQIDEIHRDRVLRALQSIHVDFAADLRHLTEALTQIDQLLRLPLPDADKLRWQIRRVETIGKLAELSQGRQKLERYRSHVAACKALLETGTLSADEASPIVFAYFTTSGKLRQSAEAAKHLAQWADAAAAKDDDAAARNLELMFRFSLMVFYNMEDEWEKCAAAATAFIERIPDPPTPTQYSLKVTAMTVQAQCLAGMDEDEAMQETLAELAEMGPAPFSFARTAVDFFRRVRPGTTANSFYLHQVQEAGLPRELEDFYGTHVLIVFWRANDATSIEFMQRLNEAVLKRYGRDKLAFVAIGAGALHGENPLDQHDVAMQLGLDSRGEFLHDRFGSVARAYGMPTYPGFVLLGPDSRFITADYGSMNFARLLYKLEIALELSEEQRAVLEPETGPTETTPEFQMLKALIAQMNFPANHPIQTIRSVRRGAIILGADGREQVRSIIVRRLLAGAPAADRRTLLNLRRLLDEF